MKLYSPTVDRDGNPGAQPSPWRPEIDWPEGEPVFLPPAELEEFNGKPLQEAVDGEKQRLRLMDQARREVEAERLEAELGGSLAPAAEAFRDTRLRPKVTEAHDFEPTVRTPVVQGLFFRNTLTWVAGTSGTFKSFVTADLAFRYGAGDGMDFHGKRMTSGRALLVVAEGAGAYADRKTAWEKHHGRPVRNVSIYPAPLQLGDTLKEMPALLSYLKEEDEAGRPFGLVLFDTQAMCTVGVDENSSEMNLVINVLHRIREVSAACVLVVHHFGKQKGAGMRGSSMIYAAADTVCILNRKEDAMDVSISTAQADGGKQKDAIAEKDILTFDMKSYPVGEDFFGDPVYSLVPVAVEGGSLDVTETQLPEAPGYLPDVTADQMFYLKLLAFYESRGATPSDMASKLEETRGAMRNGRQNVRNRMIELAKLDPPLAAQPVAKGPWVITPMGVATIARQLALGDRWVELAGPRRRRKPVDNYVDNEVSQQVSGGLAKPAAETSET